MERKRWVCDEVSVLDPLLSSSSSPVSPAEWAKERALSAGSSVQWAWCCTTHHTDAGFPEQEAWIWKLPCAAYSSCANLKGDDPLSQLNRRRWNRGRKWGGFPLRRGLAKHAFSCEVRQERGNKKGDSERGRRPCGSDTWVLPLSPGNSPTACKPCQMSRALPAQSANPFLGYLCSEGKERREEPPCGCNSSFMNQGKKWDDTAGGLSKKTVWKARWVSTMDLFPCL